MNTLSACILFWSYIHGVQPQLTNAVIKVESNGNPFAVNKQGDSGLLQIRPKFSRFTKKQLLQSCTSVMAGTEILGKLKRDCPMCLDKIYVIAYNVGRRGFRRIKHPRKFPYYRKVAAVMEEK